MSESRRQIVLIAVLVGLLLVAAVWSLAVYRGASERLRSAQDDRRAVAALAAQIQSLRRRPTLEGAEQMGQTQLTAIVQRSASAAGFNAESVIQSVSPQPDRRIPNSPYQQRSTQLRLQGVTLEQITRFLHDLTVRNPGLRVESLQLSSPGGDEAEGPEAMWNVDPLVVSFLVYAPEGGDERRADGGR